MCSQAAECGSKLRRVPDGASKFVQCIHVIDSRTINLHTAKLHCQPPEQPTTRVPQRLTNSVTPLE